MRRYAFLELLTEPKINWIEVRCKSTGCNRLNLINVDVEQSRLDVTTELVFLEQNE